MVPPQPWWTCEHLPVTLSSQFPSIVAQNKMLEKQQQLDLSKAACFHIMTI